MGIRQRSLQRTDPEAEAAKARMHRRLAIVIEVQNRCQSNDIKGNDELFRQICLALLAEGFDLDADDQKRLSRIQNTA